MERSLKNWDVRFKNGTFEWGTGHLNRKLDVQIENGMFDWKMGRFNRKQTVKIENGTFDWKMGRLNWKRTVQIENRTFEYETVVWMRNRPFGQKSKRSNRIQNSYSKKMGRLKTQMERSSQNWNIRNTNSTFDILNLD